MSALHLRDIDWNRLWQEAQKEKSWVSRGETDWDGRAAEFARRTERSPYVDGFLELLEPDPSWSVLDVGCGPGTLALPLADRCRQVSCLDFSAQMLAILEERAHSRGQTNISVHKLSWTDDWRRNGIEPHDVVIASRSLAVTDLRAALLRLNEFARLRAAITDRVGTGPFDPYAFAAIGRPLKVGPDYIYTVNLLYQLGFFASVAFIRIEETPRYADLDEAVARYQWMFRDLSPQEGDALRRYLSSISAAADDGSLILRSRHVPTWAYISWQPHPAGRDQEG